MKFYELGYDTYDEYLNSREWGEIRDIIYGSGVVYHCRVCHSKKKIKVHKRSYAYLTPDYFHKIKKNKKFLRKILVYLCEKCNKKVHFKGKEKIPLDYLFLWEREQDLYWRIDNIVLRAIRTAIQVARWIYYTYTLGGKRKRHL